MTFLKKLLGSSSAKILKAAHAGDLERVKLLLARKADVNACDDRGRTPLDHAAWNGHKKLVELLLANGAHVHGGHPRDNQGTPLSRAATNGHREVTELLLAHGALVDSRPAGCEGRPLVRAALNGHKEVVELLLANRASVNDPQNSA